MQAVAIESNALNIVPGNLTVPGANCGSVPAAGAGPGSFAQTLAEKMAMPVSSGMGETSMPVAGYTPQTPTPVPSATAPAKTAAGTNMVGSVTALRQSSVPAQVPRGRLAPRPQGTGKPTQSNTKSTPTPVAIAIAPSTVAAAVVVPVVELPSTMPQSSAEEKEPGSAGKATAVATSVDTSASGLAMSAEPLPVIAGATEPTSAVSTKAMPTIAETALPANAASTAPVAVTDNVAKPAASAALDADEISVLPNGTKQNLADQVVSTNDSNEKEPLRDTAADTSRAGNLPAETVPVAGNASSTTGEAGKHSEAQGAASAATAEPQKLTTVASDASSTMATTSVNASRPAPLELPNGLSTTVSMTGRTVVPQANPPVAAPARAATTSDSNVAEQTVIAESEQAASKSDVAVGHSDGKKPAVAIVPTEKTNVNATNVPAINVKVNSNAASAAVTNLKFSRDTELPTSSSAKTAAVSVNTQNESSPNTAASRHAGSQTARPEEAVDKTSPENVESKPDEESETAPAPTGKVESTAQNASSGVASGTSAPTAASAASSVSTGAATSDVNVVTNPLLNEHAAGQASAKQTEASAGSSESEAPAAMPNSLPMSDTHGVTNAQISGNAALSEVHVAMQGDRLGTVELHAQVEGNQIGAAIVVEKHEAHAALAVELPALQQALSEKNLRVEHVWLTQGALHSSTGGSGNGNGQPSWQQSGSQFGMNAPAESTATLFTGSPEQEGIFDERGHLSVRA